MRPAISTRPSSSPKRAPCRASRGCPRRSGPRACSAALRRPRQPLPGTCPRPAARWTRTPRPRRPRPGAARHRIPAYSPEARGRSEPMFGTLQKRLPQELRLAGITDMVEANRFLKEVFLPQHNARFATPAEDRGHRLRPLHRRAATISVHPRGTHRLKRLELQAPGTSDPRRPPTAITSRPGSASTNTPRQMAVFHGATMMARYHADGNFDSQTREAAYPLRRDRPAPTSGQPLRGTTSPQGQKPQQKRSTHSDINRSTQNVLDSVNSRGLPTATARVKRLANSLVLLGCFSMACRSSRSSM